MIEITFETWHTDKNKVIEYSDSNKVIDHIAEKIEKSDPKK